MIETMLDRPYEQVITETLFEPLALATAGFGPPAKRQPGRQPLGHYGIFRTPIGSDFPAYMAPTAAIHLSVEDWARFIRLHVGRCEAGGLSLSAHSLATLHAPPDAAAWRKDSPERGWGVTSLNYALGWYTFTTTAGELRLWHPGGNTGFIAQACIAPRAGSAMVTVTNVRTSHKRLFRVMQALKRRYPQLPGFPDDD